MITHLLKKALFLSFSFSFLLTQQIYGYPTKYVFNHITNNNGLSHNTVYDICQDSKGFMWFATEIGLNRYDGQNIKRYYYSAKDIHSLPSDVVICLARTSNGLLFAGTTNGLAIYNPSKDIFQRILRNNQSFGHFISLRQGFDTELLGTTHKNGAFIYDYKLQKIYTLKTESNVYGIIPDRENTYWAFSRYDIYRFNRNRRRIATYRISSGLFSSAISYIGTDRAGTVWVGTFDKGLFSYDRKSGQFQQLPLCKKIKMSYVRTMEDGTHPGEYWIGTESGLYIINTLTNTCEHYTQSFDEKQKTINDNAIYKIYSNKQRIYFAGTYFGGVNVANPRNIGFHAILPDNRDGFLHGKAISTIAKASDGNLWIATEDAGIAIFNKKINSFHHLLFNEHNPNSISTNNVHALLMDKKICWAGHFMGGISKIDIATGHAKRFMHNPDNPASLNNNFVFALAFLSPDSILVGSLSGVDIFDKRTETFSRFRENEFMDSFLIDIFTDPDGKIWFCTQDKGIFILDKSKRGLMTHFQAGDGSKLTSNYIISHCVDSRNQIWIGTNDGGLLKYNKNKHCFISIKTSMLIDNVVYGILEDNEGFLWISTNKGISRLNFSDSTAVHFNVRHGIVGNQHNYKSYFKDDGILYFGSISGLTWFKPETIITPNEVPLIYFTNLKIFYKTVKPGDKDGVLHNQIDYTPELKLKHNQNSFTLEFGCINFQNENMAYQYYLEGFDQNWSPLSEIAQANYTNISSGKYIFHIRAVNKMNNKIGQERRILIRISPPFWLSWIAFLFYLILIVVLAYITLLFFRNRQKEKMTLAIEKIEKDNLNLLHQHKLNFFTYITHEFKTPLSIIIASVEMLTNSNNSSDENEEIKQTIKRSATRLLFLINQLMDFRKIETDHAVISVTKGNIIDFFNQIIGIYQPLLNKKNINLEIKVSYTETELFFDFDKLEKIFTNLLTNAVKYTPQNGNIQIFLNVDNAIEFSIKDSGNGLTEKQKDKIFEAFYSEKLSNDLVESSGIGLALTASLVKLLNGEIVVESEVGKGSKFIVKLPYSQIQEDTTITNLESTVSDHPIIIEEENTASTMPDCINTSTSKPQEEYTVVIAEDNKDLLILLRKKFREKYNVKCFGNGKDAWNYIKKETPDILITDIMMPEMSGTELCQKIKTDINLCHIPVIMLTAKTSKEAKLEGLQIGADDYIYKPFSMEELELKINNILHSGHILRNKLLEISRLEGLQIPTTNQEQAFMEKILALIQENMETPELDVQLLADKLHISRSNLHTKIKSLMGMNTSEFINTVRVNKAKNMMQTTDNTLSEIAYKVGYNDSAYFTRVFKKISGIPPKEFRNSIKGKNG